MDIKIYNLIFIFVLSFTICYGKSCTLKEDPICASGGFAETLAGAAYNPALKYGVGQAKHLSKATQAAIVDTAGNWILRVDAPHKGAAFSHININPKLTGLADPHIPIPDSVVHAAGAANGIVKSVTDNIGTAAILIDIYRFASAEDRDKPKVAASMAGGYAGATGGAMAGSNIGGWVGGTIGLVFGGAGAVPGAAAGSMVGGLVGSFFGQLVGSQVAENMVE